MFAKMHSHDCDRLSSGKTFQVDTNNISITFNDWGKGFSKYLEIRATDWESYGTGGRGGDVKTVERTLYLRLNELDVHEILKYAIAAGMFPAPGMSELKTAYAVLSEAMRQLKLTSPNSSASPQVA